MKPTSGNHHASRHLTYMPGITALFLLPLAAVLASCSGAASHSGTINPADLRGVRDAETRAGAREHSAQPRPAALVNDQPITWDQLRPALAEAAGGMVLEELVLDLMLAAEYRARLGRSEGDLSAARLAAERRYLIDSIRRSGAASSDDAEELVRALTRARGLGETRFAALLKRNAMMRELVAPEVAVTPEMIRQRFEVRFGPKFRARIITADTNGDAAAALRELQDGQGELSPRFAALAARVSTDESRTRGGEIEPISPADPAYSPALRAALARLEPGQMTGILDLDPGYGIAMLQERLPGTADTFEATRTDIEDELRRRQERILMDALARRLLAAAPVAVLDPSLGWSWQNRQPDNQP